MNIKWWHIALFVAIVLAVAAILRPTELRTGWMYLRSGKSFEAIEKLRAAYENDKDNYRALRAYAKALEAAGLVEEADEAFERLIEIKPREDHFEEVVRFYSWTEQPGKRKEALRKWYEHRLTLEKGFEDEKGKEILQNLYAHLLMDQEYDEALEVLKELRMTDEENRERYNTDLITIYERTGNVEGTLTHLKLVLEEDMDNAVALEKFVQLAMLSDKKGDVEKYLVRNVERHPNDDKAWQRLINFETNIKDYDAGSKWYRRWVAERPGDEKLKRQYVEWLLWTEQQNVAMRYIQEMPREERADPFYAKTLVDLYEWKGDTAKLLPIYRSRFRSNPRDRQNAQKLVWLLYDTKDYDELERVLKKLTDLFPTDVKYAEELADIQAMKKDEAGAIKTLRRAAIETDNNEILKRLGQQYLWSTDQERTAPQKSERTTGKSMEILGK